MDYNKVLQQRNGFLKSMAEKRMSDYSLLDVYDEQLARYGAFIYQKRREFLQEFLPLVSKFYTQIAGQSEPLALTYESQLHECSFPQLLLRLRQKDCIVQRTSGGIHRDDINTQLNNQPFKSLASQGQRKSLLFAFKLAAFETLKENKGFSPILLLDDVFEKLDEARMQNLLEYVCRESGAQVFITDTHKDRLQQAFVKIGKGYDLIEL